MSSLYFESFAEIYKVLWNWSRQLQEINYVIIGCCESDKILSCSCVQRALFNQSFNEDVQYFKFFR